MYVDIAVFDELIDEKKLKKFLKLEYKIIKKQICFSSEIRLRKRYGYIYTLHTKKYKSNITRFSYGILYTLDLEMKTFNWIDMLMECRDYEKDNIDVKIIETDYDSFVDNKYKIIGKSKCICYTAKLSEKFIKIHRNRHLAIDFNKSLLIDIYNKRR